MTDSSSMVRFAESNMDPDIPVVEIETTTRYQEARAAMAVVAALRDRDVPVRDIAVVARDIDGFEKPLARAAIRHGITPVFWTQIDLVETEPYQLITSLCELFARSDPDRGVFFRVMKCEGHHRNRMTNSHFAATYCRRHDIDPPADCGL